MSNSPGAAGDYDFDEDDEEEDGDDDDIYIMMQCVSVCNEK